MKYEVLLTVNAERDLEEIYDYIAQTDSFVRAEYVLDKLLEITHHLEQTPERGSYPKELVGLGVREYRQVFFKPYRIIYRVLNKQIVIYLIVDGRRDMQSLLMHRLLSR